VSGLKVQNGVPVRYYTLGGNTLGVRQGASVSWLYGDRLGSTSERYHASLVMGMTVSAIKQS
jgi:hypothetical protein